MSDNEVDISEDTGSSGAIARMPSGGGTSKKATAVIKGSTVMDGFSQDLFVPAGSETVSQVQEKSLPEQIKEFSLGAIGSSIYNTVSANSDPDSENGIGPNMQKSLLNQMVEAMIDTPDILSNDYRGIVREIVQGSLQAAKDNEVRIQEAIKMVVTGLMAVSPHDDDPKIMSEAMKVLSSEIMYGKLNIGYSMKLASYSLGASLFVLSIYFKNYQSRIEYSKQLDQKLKYACNDGIWESTGEITGYSEEHAKSNTDRFVAGRIEEEKSFQTNLVKGVILMPLKKMENIPFVRNLMIRFGLLKQ